MVSILRLDSTGTATAWLSRSEAALLYVKNQVQWELGELIFNLTGGVNRASGQRSHIALRAIIATRGREQQAQPAPPLCNRLLFRRDNYRCMYCGQRFLARELTCDHIVPRAQGGQNRWQNVVAACKRCNHFKADRTPEQAGMVLLAVPFCPNRSEGLFLAQHQVLADQMEYLEKQFSGNRIWPQA
ncbi:HNH endonuclease [Halioxenophilus sp. WMMB6]|uniref:HNH endonuclease n=1 Tax=Halioxenophilus sp. WMMB6 TaxID=3073815 RepID=UPI00295E7333|nr:HNH endonuclease [Halioxenophilus sp. WMMB6]